MTFALDLKRAVIEALRLNPSMCQREPELQSYLKPMQGQEQKLADWTADGIPEAVILQACVETCQKFVSTPENPRIGSWRYFDANVRKAWKAHQAPSENAEADRKIHEVIAQMQQDYEKGVL